ncbi:PDC sensor domain-containing protein [Trichothermofontia sp.]
MNQAQPFVTQSEQPWRKIGLKAKLLGAVVLTIGTTALIVHLPWNWTSQRNVNSVVAQVNDDITQGTVREVDNIFSNVESTHLLIQLMFANLIDINNPDDRETFYLNLLTSRADFSWLEFGFANGNFFGVNRPQIDQISLIRRNWNPITQATQKTTRMYEIIPTGRKLLNTEITQEKYYAPQRPWYQDAINSSNKIAWSDVYVFRTSKTPGINASQAFFQEDQLVGVVSIAFELKRISDYLRTLQSNPTEQRSGNSNSSRTNQRERGSIFIINSKGELIALTNEEEAVYTIVNQDTVRLKTLAEATDPLLKIAYETAQAHQLDFAKLDRRWDLSSRDNVLGEAFYISFSSLDRLDWIVGTVIPESIYLQEINRNKRILFIIVVSFIGAAVALALYFTDRVIAAPILSITNAANEIESGEFDDLGLDKVIDRTDELGQLARVFQNMAREVYSREERLKQQVQQLQIEIDHSKRQKQVQEIVETDFFQNLQAKAQLMRRRSQNPPLDPQPPNPETTDRAPAVPDTLMDAADACPADSSEMPVAQTDASVRGVSETNSPKTDDPKTATPNPADPA